MPAEFDACVRSLMKDPDFKPRKKGQTKKDAAYAVCTASYKKKHGKLPQDASLEELLEIDDELRLQYLLLEADRTLKE